MDNKFVQYYEQELAALRFLSKEFATKYPKIAGRLLIESEGASADPHVERLMQGFAFLAGRVRKKLHDTFPEITDALLEILYPQLLRPIPSFSIAHFDLDVHESPIKSAYKIPRGTPLISPVIGGVSCKFQTCYDVTLYPIKIKDINLKTIGSSPFAYTTKNSVATLSIGIDSFGQGSFKDLKIDELSFFIDTENSQAYTLYEILMNSIESVVVKGINESGEETFHKLENAHISPIGFREDEALIPYENKSFSAYRLLQEYYSCREKFLFFKINQLNQAFSQHNYKSIEIVLVIKEFERAERLNELLPLINKDIFKLFSTPVVNLFHKRAEPVQLNQLKTEYRLSAERRFPLSYEIYSVDEVSFVRRIRGHDQVKQIAPLYKLTQNGHEFESDMFWIAKRKQSQRMHDQGTDVYISLVDRNLSSASTVDDILTLSLNCTNRDLPNSLKIGNPEGDLKFENMDPVAKIKLLRKPSESVRLRLGRDGYWPFISHLSLNHLSIEKDGLVALKEILNLYNFEKSLATKQENEGLIGIESRIISRRVGPPQRSSFCKGLEIILTIDEEQFVGTSAYLFSAILDEFLSLYVTANTFVQLKIKSKQRERELGEWKPRVGSQTIL